MTKNIKKNMEKAVIIPHSKISSNLILRVVLVLSVFLGISVFFLYRPFSWPVGSESIGCSASVLLISALTLLLWILRNKTVNDIQKKNVRIGLCIGLLWTIEISVNNFIRPGLPLRDTVDNLFWGVIEILILITAAYDVYKSGKFIDGIKSGFWSCLASGAVACLSALTVIVFGMKYILLDRLNIKEWTDMKTTVHSPGMDIYFAYQTFAGAVGHLFILGIILGLIVGSLGGLLGKVFQKKSV
jgi:hypothetical protein